MISSPSLDLGQGLAAGDDPFEPTGRTLAGFDAMRQRLWRIAQSAILHSEAWHRRVFGILLLVSFAHVATLAVVGFVLAGAPSWPVAGAALALSVSALTLRQASTPRFAGIVMSCVLVAQATLLVALFRDHPWQLELNFYFVLVIAMSAAFFDTKLLIFTAGLVTLLHFVANAVAPGVLFPGGASLGRGVLHAGLCGLETLCLALVCGALRLAVEFERKAGCAITRLEDAGRDLSNQLSTTSQRADRLDGALTAFRLETSRRLDRLQGASSNLGDTADDFSKAAERTTRQTALANAAASDVNRQVRDVAATCEDFRLMISQIGEHATQSTRIGAEAVERAMATATTIDDFTAMSDKIDTILKLIAGIASQTNLLALNATIEAARAGEQGRGFAVVAGEVKNLALQTSSAVADVNQVVTLIKGATARSVAAIAAVAASIEDLNGVATVISGAVDERIRAATAMADGMFSAANSLDHMTHAIGYIKAVADETGQGAGFLQDAAHTIAQDTAAIRDDVEAFTTDVAAA